jgi:hypothetical protein
VVKVLITEQALATSHLRRLILVFVRRKVLSLLALVRLVVPLLVQKDKKSFTAEQ